MSDNNEGQQPTASEEEPMEGSLAAIADMVSAQADALDNAEFSRPALGQDPETGDLVAVDVAYNLRVIAAGLMALNDVFMEAVQEKLHEEAADVDTSGMPIN